MKPKILILIAMLMAMSLHSLAQITTSYGAEVGVSFFHLPRTQTWQASNLDRVMREYSSVISPILGLKTQLLVAKHIQLTAGLQYQITGIRYHEHRAGRIPRDLSLPIVSTYVLEKWERQTFHKLSLPLTIGYTFRVGKIHPAIFVGCRLNLFLSGKYYGKDIFSSTNGSQALVTENEYNPVSHKQAGTPIPRISRSPHLGLSASISPQISIKASYSMGSLFFYSDKTHHSWEPRYIYFDDSTIELGVTYWFNRRQ